MMKTSFRRGPDSAILCSKAVPPEYKKRTNPPSFIKAVVLLSGLFCMEAVPARADDAPAYPLKASASNRYLVDQHGAPFLITGDAPQALTVNLSAEDAEGYFANRQSHGFNSLWINLVCNDYTAGRP